MGTLRDISGEGDSGVLGWFSNDSDSDHISVTDSDVSFEVEGFMGGGYILGGRDGRSRYVTEPK